MWVVLAQLGHVVGYVDRPNLGESELSMRIEETRVHLKPGGLDQLGTCWNRNSGSDSDYETAFDNDRAALDGRAGKGVNRTAPDRDRLR
jgi:hypothetical protein